MTIVGTVRLTTERLRLDPLRVTDAAQMVGVLFSADLYTFTGGTPPTLSDLERRYTAQIAGSPVPGESWHNWILRIASGDAIGFVQASSMGEVCDVAWLIGVEAQGVGFGREAAGAMCSWLFSAGATELQAHIHPEHDASRRVAEAVGFALTDARDDDGEDIWILGAPDVSESAGN